MKYLVMIILTLCLCSCAPVEPEIQSGFELGIEAFPPQGEMDRRARQ